MSVTLTFTDPYIVDVFTKYRQFDHNLIMRPYALFFQQFAEHFQTKQSNDEIVQQLLSGVKQTLAQHSAKLDGFAATQTQQLTSAFDKFTCKQVETTLGVRNDLKGELDGLGRAIAPLSANIGAIADKFTSTSNLVKGTASEAVIFNILAEAYPAADVRHIGATAKHECDILFDRGGDRPKILVENKDYTTTVNTRQVEKFVGDIKRHQCCGLFLSQATGITHRADYAFELVDGHVCVYLHAVKYDINKINTAVAIIDHLWEQLQLLSAQREALAATATAAITIDGATMSAINSEICAFGKAKEGMLRLIHEQEKAAAGFHKELRGQLDGLRLPALGHFLTIHNVGSAGAGVGGGDNSSAMAAAVGAPKVVACSVCGRTFANQTGLSLHRAKAHKMGG